MVSTDRKFVGAYAVVMAAIDLDMPSHGVLVATEKLARVFKAQVIGAAAGQCSLSPYYAEGPAADQYLAASRAELNGKFKALEQQFRLAHAAVADRIEWRSAEHLPDGFMLAAARCTDCIVTARPSPHANPLRSPDVSNLLMQAGRPVLVVASEASRFSLHRILIAWKDTREARRAISDALPLLTQAQEVRIVTIPEAEAREESTAASMDDVVNWLAQHGIHAAAISSSAQGTVGRAIDAAASEMDADLIVAGAYGHSRIAEWMLGGATRDLLWHAKANVLFSY